MTTISLIAAMDKQNGLGKDNKLLCYLPADLKHFKTITMGKPVIMGHSTYKSIGKPLPGRLNIVLSHKQPSIDGVEVADSLEKALELAGDSPEIMIIGGASIYEQALPLATRVYLTVIHHTFTADVFFPMLDEAIWHCEQKIFQPCDAKNSYDMTFCFYKRK